MATLASNDTAHETIGLLRFKILELDMCITLKHVLKVLPLMELQIVPDAPGYVKGLMNLQGNSVPVIDLAERLGITRASVPYTIDTPILLCEVMHKHIGLIVDEILGVVTVEKGDLQLRSEFQESLRYFTAVVNEGGRPALLVNLERIANKGFFVENGEAPVTVEILNNQLITATHQENKRYGNPAR